jgi:ABC-2 type transport system permease protein
MNVQPPLQPVNQPLLFQRLRSRLLHNAWQTMRGQSSVRPVTIILCSAFVWGFVFIISWLGFDFLHQEEWRLPVPAIIGIVFDLLFLALGLFLVFSSGLILYGSLFSSAETSFLLSQPVAADQVFAYKYQGAVGFSSWAFLLLGAPVLIAYGMVWGGRWQFYGLLPLFFLGFVLLPTCIGSIACLLIANFVPRRRKQVLALLVTLAVLSLVVWVWSHFGKRRIDPYHREGINQLLSGFSFASSMYVPSSWVSQGLRNAVAGKFDRTFFYLTLLWSNGLFLYLATSWCAARLYRQGFNRTSTGGNLRRRYGGHWLDRMVAAVVGFLRPTTRLLLIKDLRTFRRDPKQWAQILIFLFLMLGYIVNIRRMFIGNLIDKWPYRNSISLLNLCAIALLLCTYNGRFVFPMLSLEGRQFWILGLLPVKREQLLWGKFAFAATGTFLVAELLVVLSDWILGMPLVIRLLHILTAAVLAAGLSGMSVGLGAVMPNFRESDPSKIAVGFGGTLNLVACLLFLLITIGLMCLPWHLPMATTLTPGLVEPPYWLVGLGAVAGTFLGALAVAMPLHLGIQALRKMEF